MRDAKINRYIATLLSEGTAGRERGPAATTGRLNSAIRRVSSICQRWVVEGVAWVAQFTSLRTDSRHGPELFLGYLDAAWADCVVSVQPELRFFYGEAPNPELFMKDDYKVGYAKPPEATRFGVRPQPNRSLKRRTAKNAAVDVVGAINRPLTITQNGAAVRMHPHEAIMHGLAKTALRGGIRAMKEFFSQCKKAGLLDAPLAQQTTGVLTVPKGTAIGLAAYLVKIAGPPPWDNELYDCCKAEYDSDCANIQRLLEEERARRDEKAS